jgi:hypothetical protein
MQYVGGADMNFLLPQGIGDSVWALHKIQSVRDKLAPSAPIDVMLSCGERNILQDRAMDFIRRFDFVNSVDMREGWEIREEPIFHPAGYWNYIKDGMYRFRDEVACVLIPNAALERGIRIEQWLPQYDIDWNIFDHFHITTEEQAVGEKLRRRLGPYAVFYPGPLGGNTFEGHNRNMLWKPEEWVALGERIHHELGLPIVAVGASYDYDYFEYFITPRLNGASFYWTNLIGETSLGELFSVTSHAKFVISYQAGVGIVATYLRTPTAIFWRERGDSISNHGFLSFENEMASAWVPSAIIESGAHLPLIYKRHGVDYIMSEIKRRGWVE